MTEAAPALSDHAAGYVYERGGCSHAHAYLLPRVTEILGRRLGGRKARIFDLGCGNGSVAGTLASMGHGVVGVDPSPQGIDLAKRAFPDLDLSLGSAYERLWESKGTFDVVVSLEVVEHVYAPRHYAQTLAKLMRDDGFCIISTPYHGYWKNLALALSGRMDAHFTALWDHGHIKFWSVKTLTALLKEAGLAVREVHRVGRIHALAKSMLLVAERR